MAVFHAELWGSRDDKNDALKASDVTTTKWQKLKPVEPFFLFVPRDADLAKEYEKGWRVPDIFNQNGDPAPGIVTTQDEFAISFTDDEAKAKVEQLLSTKNEAEARELFRLCSQEQWSYATAKRDLPNQNWESQIVPILYRPFDVRFTVYNPHVAVHRRDRVNQHLVSASKKNIAMIVGKAGSVIGDSVWNSVTITEYPVDYNVYRRGGGPTFPLYLYSESLFGSEKRPNISEKYLAELTTIIGEEPTPETIFGYIYAVLHSPIYREKYAAFLKTDFPRVPMPVSRKQFEKLAALGTQLVALHTLDSKAAPVLKEKRHTLSKGSDAVEKPRYDASTRRVFINETQSFDNLDAEVYSFKIGGYTVADKWLSDRKGRTLSFEERRLYPQILIALAETRRIMSEIKALEP